MQEEFNINIKDNFIEEKLYKSIYDKVLHLPYKPNVGSRYYFHGAPVEKDVANYVREECEKLSGKKFIEKYTSYGMVTGIDPIVHCDYDEEICTHQVLVYIRGDEGLHRGTGFYVNNNGTQELNTHVGFRQNRAIFFDSKNYHSPLIWSDDNKSKRFSILAQFKEIK
tara:strand:+ start:1767 stop:2267 length:501 start_codon:yes stop_codon:yes gene_type:complete